MRGIRKGGALGILKYRNLKSMENFFKNTWEVAQNSRLCTKADLETCQRSKMELLTNIVNGFQPSIIFVNKSLFNLLRGLWIYPHFKYNFFPVNFQWPFKWLLPFSDFSYIVVIVKRIQNAFFLAITELIVRVRVSSNKIQTAARSKKHSWNWTISSLKLWDLNKRQIRSCHSMCSARKGCS